MRGRLAPCLLALLTFAVACGQERAAVDDPLSHLDFEECGRTGGVSPWVGGPAETLDLDGYIVRSGKYAGHIVRHADSPRDFSTLTTTAAADVAGARLELVAWIRTEAVDGWAGLWLREDGASGVVAFENMQTRGLSGTNDWTECRIVLPLHDEARDIYLGVILSGTGDVWVDDAKLLVDGKPYAETPKRPVVPTALDLDHEFDAGSGVDVATIDPWRVEALALLGRVWGFLKYHHPLVCEGARHWDYDLFRALQPVLAASDAGAARAAVAAWALGVGEPDPCAPCAEPPAADAQLRPDLAWLDDTAFLGDELSAYLHRVHAARPIGPRFYVDATAGVGNPSFDHEDDYDQFDLPDAGFRLLALYRFWNIIAYWFPNRDIIGEDWGAVLAEFVPRVVAVGDHEAYDRALLALIARVNDTHANLWSNLDARPPVGTLKAPVAVRFLGDQAVVWNVLHAELGPKCGLEIGDVIESVDGVTVAELRADWSAYYAASNEPTRLRDIGRALTAGERSSCRLGIVRDGERLEVEVERVRRDDLERRVLRDREGPTLQILDSGIAYLKLSTVAAAQCPDYIARAADTRGLIVDIRNYPSEFVPFALGGHLITESTPFVRFTMADLDNPGAFTWSEPLAIAPLAPHFAGPVAILVDETSQSQAEYTAMALRAAPGAVVVGSTTAGADGNVSRIPLPGGRSSMISGIGIFYPDRTPTQRVGIVPDIVATPTAAGIRAGRDEVLEAAEKHILGR